MKRKLFLSALLIISCVAVWSQEEKVSEKENALNVTFQYRPRAEYRNGYKTPLLEDEMSTSFINHRARLSVEYERNGLSAGLSFQNISVWGENPNANAKRFNTIMNEAWGQVKSRNGLYAKFGRQPLYYNDGRLLSISDWNQASRYHDALKFGYNTKLNQLDAILAYNQDAEKKSGGTFYEATGVEYKTMQALYYQYNGVKNFTPSVIFINVGIENGDKTTQVSKLAHLQTFGTNLIYFPIKNLRLQGIAYYQMGKRNFTNELVSAYLLSLRSDYEATKNWKFILGTDYLSGEDHDAPNPNNSYNAFYTLYAGNHGHYGVMDFFVDDKYLNDMNLGIWDNYFAVAYKPAPKLTLTATYHYFLTASKVYDAGNKLDSGLGSEIDFQVDYNLMKDVRLICGYSTFFGTPTMDYVKGGDHNVWQDWAFLTINVNPRIFSAKW